MRKKKRKGEDAKKKDKKKLNKKTFPGLSGSGDPQKTQIPSKMQQTLRR